MTTAPRRFGWRPDLPDHRDKTFSAAPRFAAVVPEVVDLRPIAPSVLDQGNLGSCVAHAILNVHRFNQRKQGVAVPMLGSRLFQYRNAREYEGTVEWDNGSTIRDGMKAIVRFGVPPEEMWPYDIARFRERPPEPCYTVATEHQAQQYRRVNQDEMTMLSCLASGYPIVGGFTVYTNFDDAANTAKVLMPEGSPIGGHCVGLYGYNRKRRVFLCQNSYGPDWGYHGYFTIPFDYILDGDLAEDFWMFTQVEIPHADH